MRAATSSDIRQMFEQSARSARDTKNKLLSFLQWQTNITGKGAGHMQEKDMVNDVLSMVNRV